MSADFDETDRPANKSTIPAVLVVGSAAACLIVIAVIIVAVVDGHRTPHVPAASSTPPASQTAARSAGTIHDPFVIGRDTFRAQQSTVAVLAFNGQAAPAAAAAPGDARWKAINVKVCIASNANTSNGHHYSLSNDPWTLTGPGDHAYPPTNVGDINFPKPQYPATAQDISPGSCVTGWIMFAVPSGAPVTLIRYSVDTEAGPPDTAYWTANS